MNRLARLLTRDRLARGEGVALAPDPSRGIGPPVDDQVGIPTGNPAIQPDPTEEYVAARGEVLAALGGAGILGRDIDDVTGRYGGDSIYELLHTDPAAGAAFDTLERIVFGSEFQVAVHKDFRPAPNAPPDAPPDADQALAIEVTAYVRRLLAGMEEPAEEVGRQLFKALRLGAMIAEKVLEFGDASGPDALRYVYRRVKVKPRTAWNFWVDAFKNVLGLVVATPEGRRVIPTWKFVIWSWAKQDGDPRGTSIYRRAFQFWQLKVQTIPEYLNYIVRFATPFLIGICGPVAKDQPELDAEGNPIRPTVGSAPKRPVSPAQRMANALQKARASMAVGLAHGSQVIVAESKGQGDPHKAAIETCDRQIVLAILGEVRSMLEAKNSSKSDSETAMDLLGTLVNSIKGTVCRIFAWQLIYPMIVLNWSKAVADRMTPELSLGGTNHADMAALMTALAAIGYEMAPSQLPYWDSWLTDAIPPRSAEEVDAYATAKTAPPPAANPPGAASPAKPEPAPANAA